MIRIDNLSLHNFRCFEYCEVDFEPDLTVFVARNGLGKTAILDSVAMALGLLVDTISGTNAWRGFQKRDIRRMHEREYDVEPEKFVQFDAIGEIEGHHLFWSRRMRTDANRAVTSMSEAKPLIGKGKEIHARLKTKDSDDVLILPLVAYYGTGRRWQNGDKNYKKPFEKVVNERCLGYADCLSGTASHSLFIEWYERTFSSLSGRSPVTGLKKADRPEYLLAAVNGAVESVLEPETGWGGLHWNADDRQLTLEHPIHGKLPLDFLSDGIRNTVALVADVAHRCARLNPQLEDAAKETTGTLIIDEVDLHLHPEWQQRIVAMLRSTFPKLQLIVTTHSPQVLSSVYAKQIRIIRFVDGLLNIQQPTFQTRGVESTDVLATIMGVDPVPSVKEADWINDFKYMIETGTHESEPGQTLKAKLIQHFGLKHPLMLDCDRLIRFTQFKARKVTDGDANDA